VVKMTQTGLAEIKTLAGAFAGCKTRMDTGKTATIASFVRGKNRIERLAFGILVAKKLGRGKAETATREELARHISKLKAHLEGANRREKLELLSAAADRHALPFFESTFAVLKIVDPDAAKSVRSPPRETAEEVASSAVIALARGELSSRAISHSLELRRLDGRIAQLQEEGLMK